MIERYDTDGDGQLSEAERQAAREDRRSRQSAFATAMEDWTTAQFDTDGDGKLSNAERAEARQFQQRMQSQMRTKFELHTMDADGDGQITQAERQAAMGAMAAMGGRMFIRMQSWMDTDGDGQVTNDERAAYQQRVGDSIIQRMGDYSITFDADGDGRLSAAERDKLIEGIDVEWDHRFSEQDANHNGRTEPEELMAVLEQFARDLGTAPPPPPEVDHSRPTPQTGR
jgi:Ca2+-binding EF-hand superfamily protein